MIGAGVRSHASEPEHADDLDAVNDGNAIAPAFVVAVTHPIAPRFEIGARADVSRRTYASFFTGTVAGASHAYREWPFDLGLAAQYTRDHVWIAPWIGPHVARRTVVSCSFNGPAKTCRGAEVDWSVGLGVGVTVGFDLWASGGDRVAMFVDAQTGAYSAIGVGLAYRR